MEIQPQAEPTVAIIGAGLTGLLAAHGLKQNGFQPVVFEQEESIDSRPRDWTMLIHWGMPLFKRLVPGHILSQFDDAMCNPYIDFNNKVESLPCYDGNTGDLLFSSPTPGSRRVSRRRLRKLLARDIDIRWNKSLVNLEDISSGVRVEFADGETVDTEYLLGTDGASSKLRVLLLDAKRARPRGSGFLFATGITKFGDPDKTDAIRQAHPVAALMMGSNSVGAVGVMSVEDPGDLTTWTTFWVKIWRGEPVDLNGQEALDYIKRKTAPLRDIFQSAVDWTPEGSLISINEMKYWTPTPWDNHNGRVTLAGDASHPMLIYRGQGFQHSITDVNNYVDALVRLRSSAGDDTLRKEVIEAYDREMIKRGAQAVEESRAEAERSVDIETARQMVMAKKGHGRST